MVVRSCISDFVGALCLLSKAAPRARPRGAGGAVSGRVGSPSESVVGTAVGAVLALLLLAVPGPSMAVGAGLTLSIRVLGGALKTAEDGLHASEVSQDGTDVGGLLGVAHHDLDVLSGVRGEGALLARPQELEGALLHLLDNLLLFVDYRLKDEVPLFLDLHLLLLQKEPRPHHVVVLLDGTRPAQRRLAIAAPELQHFAVVLADAELENQV